MIFVLSLLSVKCTRPIFIRDFFVDKPGFTIYGGNYQRNYFLKENLDTTWQKLWDVETEGSQQSSSLIIYDKYLFVSDLSGKVYAYDENGNFLGTSKYSGSISTAPLIYKQELIFALNDYNEKYSSVVYYDMNFPKVIERARIEGSVHNELVDNGSGIFVLSDQGTLYSFSYAGLKLWEFKTGVQTFCSPALFKNNLIFGNQNGEVLSVNLASREVNYRLKISSAFESGIVIKNNRAFIGDNEGDLFCFELASGKVLWKNKTGFKIKTLPVVNDSTVFVSNLHGDIFSFNINTGRLNWKCETGGVIDVTPLLSSNLLLQPNQNKKLYMVNVSSGKIVKSIDYPEKVRTTPLFYNNTLYIGVDKGNIYAYKVGTY